MTDQFDQLFGGTMAERAARMAAKICTPPPPGEHPRIVAARKRQLARMASGDVGGASIASPHLDPPEVEDLARRLAPPINLVWDYDKRTNDKLLYAAKELFRLCKNGDIDDVLDALDTYTAKPKNRQWLTENDVAPKGLATVVAEQFQRMQTANDRHAAANTPEGRKAQYASDLDAAARSQAYLEEHQPQVETVEESRWQAAQDTLRLEMVANTFNHLFRGSYLESLDPAVLVVRSAEVRETLEARWTERVARVLLVETVTFREEDPNV